MLNVLIEYGHHSLYAIAIYHLLSTTLTTNTSPSHYGSPVLVSTIHYAIIIIIMAMHHAKAVAAASQNREPFDEYQTL